MGGTKREIEANCFLLQAEDEGQRYGRNKDTVINRTYINSGSYRRKFDFISNSSELNRLIFQLSKKMLEHRSGTKYDNLITLHSHPNSYPPSIGLGIVVCHDGKIFKYASNQEIREDYYKMVVEKNLKKGYNESEAQIEALKELVTKFDIMVKEVTEDDM